MAEVFPSIRDIRLLLKWFDGYGTNYPWSAETGTAPDPYAVWISEVMLQQTTVAAVLPRYKRWMDRFPAIETLAQASRDEVFREWEGLGYYSRAGNLHSAAREIKQKYGSRIPESVSELRELPGIGEYIASAVASFAFGKKILTIEANGRRIVQRLTASEKWDRNLERIFRNAAEQNMPNHHSGKFNASLMQFGQKVCLPGKPKCDQCPFAQRCEANSLNLQEAIPVRHRPTRINKTTNLALAMQGGEVWIRIRSSGIAAGLWGFPETAELSRPEEWVPAECLSTQIHSYTRYRDKLQPTIYLKNPNSNCGEATPPTPAGQWINVKDLDDFGMPTAHRSIARNLSLYLKSTIIDP